MMFPSSRDHSMMNSALYSHGCSNKTARIVCIISSLVFICLLSVHFTFVEMTTSSLEFFRLAGPSAAAAATTSSSTALDDNGNNKETNKNDTIKEDNDIATSSGEDANHHQQCIQYVTTQKLPRLIAKLSDDPETNGLKPLHFIGAATTTTTTSNATNNNNNHATDTSTNLEFYMQGLDLNTFRKRRMALMGDSTLFYMTKHLYVMLLDKDPAYKQSTIIPRRQDPGFSNMTLSEGKKYVEANAPNLGVSLGCCQPPRPIDIRQEDGTYIEWMGMSGPAEGRTKEKLDSMFARAEKVQPEVIVTNMGLHWLHLCGHARCPMDAIVVKLWLDYKNEWLNKVYDFALKVKAKLLLFKTTNFVCDSIRTGDWATYSSLYLAQDSGVIENCTNIIESLVKGAGGGKEEGNDGGQEQQQQEEQTYNFTEDQIRHYCQYGQFTQFGVEYLNRQILDFVHEHQHQQRNDHKNSSTPPLVPLVVGLYNDHDVETCNTTKDAIHHRDNIELRVRLLGNTIDEYYTCIDGHDNVTNEKH